MSVNAVITTQPPVEVVTEAAAVVTEMAANVTEVAPVIVATTTSAFDQIKTGVVCIAQWLGRQVSLIASTLKSVIAKIAQAVKPVFESIVAFFSSKAVEFKQLIVANQSVAITALVAIPATALFVIAGSYLFGSNVAKANDLKV